jgi:hypothetical protein
VSAEGLVGMLPGENTAHPQQRGCARCWADWAQPRRGCPAGHTSAAHLSSSLCISSCIDTCCCCSAACRACSSAACCCCCCLAPAFAAAPLRARDGLDLAPWLPPSWLPSRLLTALATCGRRARRR